MSHDFVWKIRAIAHKVEDQVEDSSSAIIHIMGPFETPALAETHMEAGFIQARFDAQEFNARLWEPRSSYLRTIDDLRNPFKDPLTGELLQIKQWMVYSK